MEKVDFEESQKIHVNNRKRLLRAISLIRHSEINKTEIIQFYLGINCNRDCALLNYFLNDFDII